MNKPVSFTKPAKRDIRIARGLAANHAIGTIEHGTDTFILTFGQFSLGDALVALIDQAGPSTVDLCTWTAADADLTRTAALLESAAIARFRLIVDRSFETRQPEYFATMRQLFGPDCIRAIRGHAKFMVVRSDTHNLTVRTSMNLNENPRLENIEISEGKPFADFMTGVVDQIFDEVNPEQNSSVALELANLEESSPFKAIDAPMLRRSTLHEPHTTHAVK